MSIASEAIRLHSLGFEPIALVPGEKRPVSPAWQTHFGRTPEAVAADFAQPGVGLGILTGRGLVVVDVDYKPEQGVIGAATMAELSARLGPLPHTVTARTASGGSHFYFSVPADTRVPNSAGKLGKGVDVRGDGGQVVAAPTVLSDGREYAWLEQARPGMTDLAPLPAKWLAAMLEQPARAARPASPAPAAPGLERLEAPVTRASGLARARAYLAAMPPAVAGQGGHATTFDAACRAVQRCTSVEDAWTVLLEYNERCDPPWSEQALRHKLDDALEAHQLASALEAPPAPAAAGDVAAGDDELDRIDEKDNLAFWMALRAFNKDNPQAKLPEVLDEETVRLLKQATKRPDGSPGRPGSYLDKKWEPLDFRGLRPSQYAYDEHKTRPWRRCLDGRWSEGASDPAIEHELTNVRMNRRSRDEFKLRARHVADALCVYDSRERFVELPGVGRVLNVYEPSRLESAAGDWSALRTVLLNLHDGNAEHLEWTLDWLATWVRDVRAGRPQLTGVAVVYYGPEQGAGKGVFGEVLKAILGSKNVVTIRQQELDETFNGWAAGRLLCIGNEVFSSDNRTQSESNKLKPYISDQSIQVREMYAAPMERRNVSAWIFFSNDLRPVTVEQRDRRFTVFRVGGAIPPALGGQVSEDARAGGPIAQAFLHELLTRSISRFQRFVPLVTEAKSEVQFDTASSAEKFVLELTKGDGFHALAADYIRECGGAELYARLEEEPLVERRVLYEVYERWAQANGYRAIGSSQLYRLLRAHGLVDQRRRWGSKQTWFFAGLRGMQAEAFGTVPGVTRLTTRGPMDAGQVRENIENAKAILGAP